MFLQLRETTSQDEISAEIQTLQKLFVGPDTYTDDYILILETKRRDGTLTDREEARVYYTHVVCRQWRDFYARRTNSIPDAERDERYKNLFTEFANGQLRPVRLQSNGQDAFTDAGEVINLGPRPRFVTIPGNTCIMQAAGGNRAESGASTAPSQQQNTATAPLLTSPHSAAHTQTQSGTKRTETERTETAADLEGKAPPSKRRRPAKVCSFESVYTLMVWLTRIFESAWVVGDLRVCALLHWLGALL